MGSVRSPAYPGDLTGHIPPKGTPSSVSLASPPSRAVSTQAPFSVSVKVFSAWTGSFTDVALAKETARSLIAQGADVTFMEANESNIGIISATEETKTFAIGYAMDQSKVGPNSVLTSTLIHFPLTYGWVIDAVKDARFDGKTRKMGLAEKVIQLAPFHSFDQRISPELRKRLDEATALLIEKKISALPRK